MRTRQGAIKPLILLLIALFSGTAASCNTELSAASKEKVELAEVGFPGDTAVLIRANTITGSDSAGLKRRSEFYYYDQSGILLQTAVEDEEQFGSCMLFRENKACFFLRNKTIIQTLSGKAISFSDYDESVGMKGNRFGVSKCGYIESSGEMYALRNVGKKSPDVPYINTIRIAGKHGS